MNSRNKIILGCLSLLVIASVGYALFSEKISINGVAKGKSDMDVVVTSCNRIGPDLTEEEMKAKNASTESGVGEGFPNNGEEGTCEILEDGTIRTTSALKKPGDSVFYSVFIKNNGEMPIRISEINSPNNVRFESGYDTYVGDEWYLDNLEGISDEPWNHDPLGINYMGAAYSLIELLSNGEGKYIYPNNAPYNPSSDSSIEGANIIIEPKNSIFLLIGHEWDNYKIEYWDTPQPTPPKDGFKMAYNIQLVFEQVM